MTKLSEQQILLIAEQLAAANFAKTDQEPTAQMFDITKPYGLTGDPDEVKEVGCLCCVLALAADIATLQASTLIELSEMIRADMSACMVVGATKQ